MLGMESAQEMALWAAVGLILLFIVKNAYLGLLTYARARYTANRQCSLSNRLFQVYLRSPYTFHLQRNTAELLRNTNSEANAIMGNVLLPLMSLVMEAMVLALIFVLLFAVEPTATLFVFGVFGLITYLFPSVYAGKGPGLRERGAAPPEAVGAGGEPGPRRV